MLNFNIHTGLSPESTRNLWVPQLKNFQNQFETKNEAFRFVLDWMLECKPKANPNQANPKMTGGLDAFPNKHDYPGNHRLWSRGCGVTPMNQLQFDMFTYSFLVATRSQTNENGKRINGFSQLDVLNRGALISLGKGIARSAWMDIEYFEKHRAAPKRRWSC